MNDKMDTLWWEWWGVWCVQNTHIKKTDRHTHYFLCAKIIWTHFSFMLNLFLIPSLLQQPIVIIILFCERCWIGRFPLQQINRKKSVKTLHTLYSTVNGQVWLSTFLFFSVTSRVMLLCNVRQLFIIEMTSVAQVLTNLPIFFQIDL